MICVHCSTFDQIDAVWRMLTHVPVGAFVPVDLYQDGAFRYRVIRTDDDEQTTAPLAAPQVGTPPAP
jgi:hypothetical protein